MKPFSWIAVATLGLCAPLLSGCVKSDAKYYRCAGFTQSDIKVGEKVFFNPDKRKYVDNIIVEIPKPSLKLFFATKLKTSHVLILNGTPYAVKVNSIYMYETLFMGNGDDYRLKSVSDIDKIYLPYSWWFKTDNKYVLFDQVGRKIFIIRKFADNKGGEVSVYADLKCEKIDL